MYYKYILGTQKSPMNMKIIYIFLRQHHIIGFSAVLDIAHPLKPLKDDRFHGKNEFS